MSRVTTVVVTGGPCGGKSTFLAMARQFLEDRGCRVGIVPEAATELILAGFPPYAGWKEDTGFQRELLRYMQARRAQYIRMMEAQDTDRPKVLLFDRAELDARGTYISTAKFDSIASGLGILPGVVRDSYDGVLHLVTAADGAAEFYTLANNKARSESPEDAIRLDGALLNAWNGHPHRAVIDNRTDFEGKKRRALQCLARVLHMPEPQEIERKWRVLNFGAGFEAPSDAAVVEIEQTYLMIGAGPLAEEVSRQSEWRVRRRSLDGNASYYSTIKRATDVPAVRIEHETQITEDAYKELLEFTDPSRLPVHKTRYVFTYAGRVLELDVYRGHLTGLVTLEAELPSLEEDVELPHTCAAFDVTDDSSYRNAELALRTSRVIG